MEKAWWEARLYGTVASRSGQAIDAVDDEFRSTPLSIAARWGRREVVRLLLDRGADPNSAVASRATPLSWAVKKGHSDIAAVLRSAGTRVNRRLPVDFRQFLIRHAELFRFLHTWTVRLLVPRRFRKAVPLYKAALREELWTPLNPSVTTTLETYFPQRQAQGDTSAIPTIAPSETSSARRGCRRSKPCIGPGDDRETGFSGRLTRLACGTIDRAVVPRLKSNC